MKTSEHKSQTQGKSQKQRILNAMLAGQRLTCLDGLKKFDCLNLRNRIVEIRKEGVHKVTKAWKRTKSGKNVRVYSIDI